MPDDNQETEQNQEQEQQKTPTLEELQKELEKTQKALKEANDESATRRHKIKELTDQLAGLQSKGKTETDTVQEEITRTKAELVAVNARLREHDLRRAFVMVAEAEEVKFASATALDDAFSIALPMFKDVEIDGDGSVSKKEVKEVLEKVLKGRDYLTKRTEAPDNDANKKGAGNKTLTDEELLQRKKQQIPYSSL